MNGGCPATCHGPADSISCVASRQSRRYRLRLCLPVHRVDGLPAGHSPPPQRVPPSGVFGLFIGLFGARMLAQVAGLLLLAPNLSWPATVEMVVNYVLVIPAMLFWVELSTGALRQIFCWLTLVAAIIATLGPVDRCRGWTCPILRRRSSTPSFVECGQQRVAAHGKQRPALRHRPGKRVPLPGTPLRFR